jgi:patatin-like phospholipase/acyl hydrolase
MPRIAPAFAKPTARQALRGLTGKPTLVLADFFDYVGGTSCGAIIAALIAMGKSMDEIRTFFVSSCPDMFLKARL